ncbi:amidase [Chroogloeocystis siderophila]|jgi:amidase|uniref:Amidase n=1 Tax=Chroogloeocystis siderophila 5.2 s.c.1 TaxID=247279 RepID=A0A1U7HRZ9_9CHRO|nr:amidase [Chroogloeocystis siderophila 5.2 s.c.1]
MVVKKPTLGELDRISQQYHLELTPDDLASFQSLMSGTLASYSRLDELTEPTLPVKYPRTPGYRPLPHENPYNAWYWKTSIKGAASGILTGKAIAIKDNVCVAGVPMMNGTAVLEGYVPEVDATIVKRILDAGGEIAGKAVCESLCFSGSSFTADTGAVRNPHDESRTAGGSSSGSAALVAGGVVDMAIGGDQGGSIRIPASWCGIVGLKPTYGLVPYTGIFPIELTLDHTGPMARTVQDVALLLEAIAGADGLDPRQYNVQTAPYTASLTGEANNIRVGIVKEGFGILGLSEADVDEIVMEAAYRLEKVGCKVSEISIPMHRDGLHIWTPIATEGATMLMVKGNSMGTNWKGHYTTSLLDVYARGWQSRADDLSETTKLVLLAGQYMQDKYHGRYYAKAQNLGRLLKNTYDAALQECDVLVMPTLPLKATKLPASDASREERIARALEMLPNTAPFDVTGHPALSINAGMSAGLPVGMMLVGRYWDETTVLRVAHAFEQLN